MKGEFVESLDGPALFTFRTVVLKCVILSAMQAYCSKCKTMRDIANAQTHKTADDKSIVRGVCSVCGSAMMRLMTTDDGGRVTHEPRTAKENVVAYDTGIGITNNDQPATSLPSPTTETPKRTSRGRIPKKQTSRSRSLKRKEKSVSQSADIELAQSPVSSLPSPSHGGDYLVIVESPAKAKTIGKFLGRGYRVRASVGHVRDLPVKAIGVDLEHDFRPQYVVMPKKQEVIAELRDYAKGASEIYLATDPDREGEAISWHLASVLKLDIAGKPVRRVEFHEITRDAIANAFAHPRAIDMDRVNAQQARRLLDRIVGYTISPLLSKKIAKGHLSAGRVQSVALRLVVEREREIQNFVPVEYWSIEAELRKQGERETGRQGAGVTEGQSDTETEVANSASNVKRQTSNFQSPRFALRNNSNLSSEQPNLESLIFTPFRARLVKVGDKDFECHSGEEALKLKETLEQCAYRVLDVRRKDVQRNPLPPFITSTLQQDASRKLGFNPKRTMRIAQELYEGLAIGDEGTVGLITYMRTDSTNIAASAQKEAWAYIKEKFGESYLPAKPRVYSKKVSGAQEAHEAIRPTKTFREPNAIRQYLDADQFKVYDLIWKRFVASQMASAVFDTTAVDIEAKDEAGRLKDEKGQSIASYLFRANGSILKFAGYLAVYGRSVGDEDEEDDSDKRLPPLIKDEPLDLLGIYPEQHFSEPPPRYTEATLIKALEQYGIGRPSTYAPILSNIQDRGYIEQIENRRLKPTDLGFVINHLLVTHFTEIMDVGFTAQMEDKLDAVEEGKQDWIQLLRDFYTPFKQTLDRAAVEMPIVRLEDEKTDIQCDVCGAPMVIKRGRYGKFLSCSNFPRCKNAKPLTTGVRCPKCKQGELREKKSKKGRIFYGCSRYPDCDFAVWDKPVPDPCPKCGSLMVQGARGSVRCVNGDYTAEKTEGSSPQSTGQATEGSPVASVAPQKTVASLPPTTHNLS